MLASGLLYEKIRKKDWPLPCLDYLRPVLKTVHEPQLKLIGPVELVYPFFCGHVVYLAGPDVSVQNFIGKAQVFFIGFGL